MLGRATLGWARVAPFWPSTTHAFARKCWVDQLAQSNSHPCFKRHCCCFFRFSSSLSLAFHLPYTSQGFPSNSKDQILVRLMKLPVPYTSQVGFKHIFTVVSLFLYFFPEVHSRYVQTIIRYVSWVDTHLR